MNTYDVAGLKEGATFSDDIFIDELFILEPAGAEISQEVLDAVKAWEFSELTSHGIADKKISVQEDSEESHSNNDDIASENLKKILENAKIVSGQDRLASVQSVYDEYLAYINHVYTRYATHHEINQENLAERIKDLCVFIKENKRYVLRITPSTQKRSSNFLVIHTMRSTVFAISIGLQLRLPLSKLIELGVSCLLHEIGMIQIPPQLYITNKQLSQTERAQIATHPIIGYKIVKDLKFPLSIQLGILEHHEKVNGTGYPRRLTGEQISLYAKIIAVACSFEAISAPREHKAEQSTFAAMVELLKNSDNQYDGTVTKALLYTLSLYPIGAYVYLSNGKIAQVIDTTPDNPKYPIVQVLEKNQGQEAQQSFQTNDSDMKIVRVLSKEESNDVLKSLNVNN